MSGRPRKLSDDGVAEIRAWYAAKRKIPTSKQMQHRLGVCSSTLSKVGRGIKYNKARRGEA